MTQDIIEDTARHRLRSLRIARGWSLDELARRSHIGASTISRIETGQRRLALDHLVTLARALDTTIDELLVDDESDDVVIRPTRDSANGATYWMLTRPDDPSGRMVAKIRLPARKRPLEPQVHPGRDWFYVINGAVRLRLGEREHLVRAGQAAEFDTMTPHWMAGNEGPAEIITILDHHGERTHLRVH
jgi:transcriptional regulator with XRE-family HTH domain